jgi:prepilin-type N-terminal cleavage/methylation domain-containing protein
MTLPKLNFHLYQAFLKVKQSKVSGFTLLELLVAMIVSSIVVSGLLYIMVELLKTDRRESVLDQTQRDIQRAVDYISDDIREAVYIYSTPSTVTAQITNPPGGVPILAFWRPDPVTDLPTCSTLGASTTTIFQQC